MALIGSFAAGLYDLATSNVPDKLCIGMIVFGLLVHSYTGIVTGDFSNLVNAILFGGIFIIFGLVMYHAGQWGGGDGELLVTIGVLLPTMPTVTTYFPFSISFFLNSFFIGAAYSIIYSGIMMYRVPKMRKKFTDGFKDERIRFGLLIVLVLGLFFLITQNIFLSLISFVLMILVVFQRFTKAVEEGFLVRIPTSKLKVDDTIGQDLPKLGIRKKLIKGLTKNQVRKIKKYRKHVIVREGIRYGLVFPLSILFTLFFGDFIFLLLPF